MINIIRIWLLYFDMNISKFKNQNGWRIIIDPNCQSTNWYFQKLNTYGNSNYLFKYGFLFVLVCSTIRIVLSYTFDIIFAWLFTYAIYSLQIVAPVVIYFKLRHFYYDSLFIRQEFLTLFWLMLACLLMVILTTIFDQLFLQHIKNEDNQDAISNLLWVSQTLTVTNVVMYSLIWVPRRLVVAFEKQYKKSKKSGGSRDNSSDRDSRGRSSSFSQFSATTTKTAMSHANDSNTPVGAHTHAQVESNTTTPAPSTPISSGAASITIDFVDAVKNGHASQSSSDIVGHNNSKHVNKHPSTKAAKEKKLEKEIRNHWSKIIVTSFGYESFMKHLEKELSIENLLFITEVGCQY